MKSKLKYYRVFFLIPSTKCKNCLPKYFDKKLKYNWVLSLWRMRMHAHISSDTTVDYGALAKLFCNVVCLCLCICGCLCVTKISSDTTVGSGALAVIVISFVFAFVFVFIFVCVFVFVLTALWQNYCSMTWGCLGRGGDSLSLWHEEGGGVMFEDNYLNLFPFSPGHFIFTFHKYFWDTF